MNEAEALSRMIAPGTPRDSKWRKGVIQILVTSSCDKACYNCTQLSQIRRPHWAMTPNQFEQAVLSLKDYFGVVGVFGGNPAVSPHFRHYCDILRKHIPFEQRGLWCNHPLNVENAMAMRATFNPAVSNLNVHLDQFAYDLFVRNWPECRPVGLHEDSRHSPPFVAMRDVLKKPCPNCEARNAAFFMVDPGPCETCGISYGNYGQVYDEERAWELISGCDINQHWSAGIGVFRGQLRAWFCEIAMAQSIYHQDDACLDCDGGTQLMPCKTCGGSGRSCPDTGVDLAYPIYLNRATGEIIHCLPYQEFDAIRNRQVTKLCAAPHGRQWQRIEWWQLPMSTFAGQVRKHCHECGIPLRGYGELAQSSSQESREQVSETHAANYKPKKVGRRVELVTVTEQLGKPLEMVTRYLQNAKL